MIEFAKKNKKIILNSSIFLGINNNIFCGSCCSKISGKNNNNTDHNKNNQQDQPTQDQPHQDEQNELDQIYSKFCTLYEYVSKNYDKITTGVKYELSTIKSIAYENKNNKIILEQQISILDGEKKKIDDIIKIEKNNKKPDPVKDPTKDNDPITEIQPIDFSTIPVQDIEEKYDTTGININFINKDNFIFKSTKFSYKDGNKLDDKDFTILENLIKDFLAKKNLKGNFTIDYIKPEHLGVNPILRIKITNDDLNTSFCAFIKNESCSLLMFKLFQIVDLLPFEYYIDLKNKLIITEDLNEKGYEFLDNQYCPTTHRNKEIWSNCTNINEFRFWCYILNCDDIDPMYKYDNCCFKDNKVYALDLRCIYIDNTLKSITTEDFFMKYCKDYNGFLRGKIRKINTNNMVGYEDTEQYKIWDESIKIFDDFTDEEKTSINKKILKLIYYIVGIFKDNKKKSKENLESKNYLSQVCCNIMDFLQFYICKYKKKYTKFEYNGKTLKEQYNGAEYKWEGYSYGKANGIFKKLLDENKIGFEYFLTSDTLVKLYDIYRNKPDGLFYGYITTDVNKYNL